MRAARPHLGSHRERRLRQPPSRLHRRLRHQRGLRFLHPPPAPLPHLEAENPHEAKDRRLGNFRRRFVVRDLAKPPHIYIYEYS